MNPGTKVEHSEYGFGVVQKILGNTVVVSFTGEEICVDATELRVVEEVGPKVIESVKAALDGQVGFRKAYEAVNLGVVPPGSKELIALTISGVDQQRTINGWLSNASREGLCKVVFGHYGAGKSHFLHLVKAIALQAGWATAFLEFDPKAADPAKPHLVYRGLMSNLEFPERENGSRTRGFLGLVKELRKHWDVIRDGPWFRLSPWFCNALGTLLRFPHNEDQDYIDGCEWLAGNPTPITLIRSLARTAGYRGYIPLMPRQKESSDIYVLHLVVMHEICRSLGYKGLVLILDEAEHVRGYDVRRQSRANNFFDLLARCAHMPLKGDTPPIPNEHDQSVPPYWERGPHFALFVGLTQADSFINPSLSLREACVFLHHEEDRILLKPPSSGDYENWCLDFLGTFHRHYPLELRLIAEESARRRIASVLRQEFETVPDNEKVLRTWIKLAALAPSALLAKRVTSVEELAGTLQKAAQEATGNAPLPWEL